MQNVMHVATNAGHTAQNDGQTMRNVGRNTLNVYQGPKGGLRRAPGDPPTPIHSRLFSNFSKCLTYSINDISCSCRGKTTEEDLVFKIFLLIELSSIFKISLG